MPQLARGKYRTWLEPDNLLRLAAWARDGLTDEQIASNMGISRSTLSEWKKKYQNISDALKKGKEVIDIQVENALLKRALGYSYEEVTKERILDTCTGESTLTVTKVVTKQMSPDVTAQIFWLKNRRPVEWRDRKDIAVSGKVNNPFEGITTEELKKLIRDG